MSAAAKAEPLPMTARSDRLRDRFAGLRAQNRAGLVTFITACDPDPETSQALLNALPNAGVDIIELGMPFTDPMADGPSIQKASQRALAAGGSMDRTLAMVEAFRATDRATPIVLMGYYNPIYRCGVERFAQEAAAAGVDGVIVVDLPPEEADELTGPLAQAGIDLIILVAPTTTEARLHTIAAKASGFLYYVSIAGITGTAAAAVDSVAAARARIAAVTDLPVAVGFGIREPAQAAAMAQVSDACVVGSAVVDTIAAYLDDHDQAKPGLVDAVTGLVGDLASAVHSARGKSP